MAEYKKKKHSGRMAAPKTHKNRIKREKPREDIELTSYSSSPDTKPQNNMKVVRGKKLKTKYRFKVFFAVVIIVALVLVLCEALTPAGVFETLSTFGATIGSGSYPTELDGLNTTNVVSKGSYYYVLTNSKIEAYSTGGKRIFSHTHGFEKPIIKASKTRALVFGQNSDEALIFTLKGLKSTVKTEDKIKNAAIGDDGTYAFITTADNYSAKVTVYRKNNKLLYEWFSSQDLINNVAVSANGKKIAVSAISSDVSDYNSRLLVLNFGSSKPEFEKNYDNTLIYGIDSSFISGFSVLTANKHDFIKWSNSKINEYENDYSTAMFRTGNSGMAVLYNRENDKTDNRIAIFNKQGKLKQEIKFKGIITDFALKDGLIYALCDSKIYALSKEGKILKSAEYGFGAVRICPVNQSTMAVITDNAISKIKLE